MSTDADPRPHTPGAGAAREYTGGGDQPSWRLPDLQTLRDLVIGRDPGEGRLGALPPALAVVASAMLSANGSGRHAALLSGGPGLAAAVIAEIATPPRAGIASFPVEVLPQPLRQLVVAAAAATNTPPEFAAVPALAIAAGIIGNTARLQFKQSWVEYAPLWVCVVGEPGSGKTPALKAVRAPLQGLIRDALREYEHDQEMYAIDLADWGRLSKAQRGPEPSKPTLERFLASDTTFEALKPLLSSNPGIVLIKDEFAAWVASFDAYRTAGKGSDRANWLSLWSDGTLSVDRVSQEHVYLEDAVIAICGSIQPERLSELANEAKASDGFLERILFCYPQTEPRDLSPDDVDERLTKQVGDVLRTIRGYARGRREPASVRLDAGADAAFRAWHTDNVQRCRETSGLLRSYYLKLPSQLLKLLLVLHCLHYPASPATPVQAWEVDHAILLVEYFRHHAHRTLAMIGASGGVAREVAGTANSRPADLLAERILALLRERYPDVWVGQRDLNVHLGVTAAARQEARDLLVARGLLLAEIQPAAGRGRPAERWRLVTPASGSDYV